MNTGMLASVATIEEARTVLAAGVDIIDLKNPANGVLGAVDHDVARRVVEHVAQRKLVSATIGDLPMQPGLIAQAIAQMSATGVDIVKVGIFSGNLPGEFLKIIEKQAQSGIKIVLVMFADLSFQPLDIEKLADTGVMGIMLDTANKESGSLRTILDDNQLMLFVKQVQDIGLMAGLAGSLRLDDISPLLALKPDYLGFRGALCQELQRVAMIDALAVRRIRSMIPKPHLPEQNETLEQIAN